MSRVATLFLALGLVLPKPCSAQAAPPPPQFFDSDGVRIRYVVRGAGPPLLLVHGFAVSIELNWGGGILDSLASTHTVIALDLRGHGQSDKPRESESYGVRFVDDLVNLLDHLQIERADVVGYSLGAAITLKLLTAHPERVRSAVLGAGGWLVPGERPPPWRVAWLNGLERIGAEGGRVMDVLRQPDWPELPPEVEAAVNANDPNALAAALGSVARLAVTEAELRANTVPTIAIVGADDVMVREDVDRMAAVMARLEMTRITDANHITALSHPLLLETILEFLRAR